jgi:hypothetical protein
MLTKTQLIKSIWLCDNDKVWKECQRYGVQVSRNDYTEESGRYEGVNTWLQYQHLGLIVTLHACRGEVTTIETAPV